MDKEQYLQMNSEELYTHLFSFIMQDLEAGELLLNELAQTERYQSNYEFRTSVETARALKLAICGQTKEVISLCTDLIEITGNLKLWLLTSTNWNLLGTAYNSMGMHERSIECYYHVIQIEKKHGLNTMSSLAYNNIALTFMNFKRMDKAVEYFNNAIHTLYTSGEHQPRYHAKMLLYLSNYLIAHCLSGKTDNLKPLVDKLDLLATDNMDINATYSYYNAKQHYYFNQGDYEMAKTSYFQAKEFIPEDNIIMRLSFFDSFLELSKLFKLDRSFYLEELLNFEGSMNIDHAILESSLYKELRDYYQSIGDDAHLQQINAKYINFLEKQLEMTDNRSAESLLFVSNMLDNKQDIEEFISKNSELKFVAAEAIRSKELLQSAYHQIEMISELGQNLTSSLNLKEVVQSIYNNLKRHMPIHSFLLLSVEENKNRLRSIAHFEYDKEDTCFTLDLDNDDSCFVKAYRKNEILSTVDNSVDEIMKNINPIIRGTFHKSLVFMPLNIGERTIGLCSIQYNTPSTYTQEHIDFLSKLSPYLSISLNNAIHSERLEKEIQSHLSTQTLLQDANAKLEKISSLDGLTQISSRREFDNRILELMKAAAQAGTTLTIFMLDIDNFKLYNDTYGHLEGDEVLKKIALSFRKDLDTVSGLSARFGGEEFIGACVGMDYEQSSEFADRIRQNIFNMGIEHKVVPSKKITVSIGVAISKHVSGDNKSNLLKLADLCLYEAKNTQKNKVVVKEY